MSLALSLLGFLATGLVLVVAGTVLARAADAIADATKIGRIWIGTVLLAGATSLPELATDVAAVRLGAPDLAVGDLFGSSMANMLILAIIDLLPPRRAVLRRVAFDHALAACLAIGMTATAALALVVRPATTLLGVSPFSTLLLLTFVFGTRAVYLQGRRAAAEVARGAAMRPSGRLAGPIVRFALAAAVILVAAPRFARYAERIAEVSGLGDTFVGTWLVGLATSLPELVASLAALRMGAFDLAVGNLFGSNAFNMVILLALDVTQPGGSVLPLLDPGHLVAAMAAILLMSLGLAAIVYRAERRFSLVEPSSAGMLIVYLAALWLLYARAAG